MVKTLRMIHLTSMILIAMLATILSSTSLVVAVPLMPGTLNMENTSGKNLTASNAVHIQLCSSHYPCTKKSSFKNSSTDNLK